MPRNSWWCFLVLKTCKRSPKPTSPPEIPDYLELKKLAGKSWRLDETYVKVKDQWKYLYRAVDKEGNTIDYHLTAKRDRKAAKRFICKAIG